MWKTADHKTRTWFAAYVFEPFDLLEDGSAFLFFDHGPLFRGPGLPSSHWSVSVCLRRRSARLRRLPAPAGPSWSTGAGALTFTEPTRSASRPTRSSRLGGASPISFSFYSDSGRTLELRRSGRNAGAIGASAARYGVFANSPLAGVYLNGTPGVYLNGVHFPCAREAGGAAAADRRRWRNGRHPKTGPKETTQNGKGTIAVRGGAGARAFARTLMVMRPRRRRWTGSATGSTSTPPRSKQH